MGDAPPDNGSDQNQSQIVGGKAFWQDSRVSTHAQKQEMEKRLGSGEEEGGEE